MQVDEARGKQEGKQEALPGRQAYLVGHLADARDLPAGGQQQHEDGHCARAWRCRSDWDTEHGNKATAPLHAAARPVLQLRHSRRRQRRQTHNSRQRCG